MSYSKFIQGIKNGAISSLSSGLICQPFQVVSTNMMVSYKQGKPISMLSTIKMIIQNEGLRGFYRGFKPATLKNIFGSAIYFACLEALKPKVKSNITSNPNFVNFISAAISRTIQMISVAPIYVMKTRFEVSGFNKYSGIFDAVRKIKQEEGYSGFFRGLSTTLIKEVPYSALFYTTFDFTKKTLKKYGIVNTQVNSSCASLIAVAILTVLTNPLEVIRTRLQYQHVSQNVNHKYKGAISGIFTIARKEGIKGLSAGMGPIFVKKGISTLLVWTLYDTLNHMSNRRRNKI